MMSMGQESLWNINGMPEIRRGRGRGRGMLPKIAPIKIKDTKRYSNKIRVIWKMDDMPEIRRGDASQKSLNKRTASEQHTNKTHRENCLVCPQQLIWLGNIHYCVLWGRISVCLYEHTACVNNRGPDGLCDEGMAATQRVYTRRTDSRTHNLSVRSWGPMRQVRGHRDRCRCISGVLVSWSTHTLC